MIEELVAKVFATRNAAHIAHWASKSFSQHSALGDFYDALIDKIDAIVETCQGAHGLIGDVPSEVVPPRTITEHIAEEAQWIEDNREDIANGCKAVENLLDDLTATYLTTYYKLTNLR
jgi:hypothetical protein